MKEHYPPVDDVALKQDKKRVSYYYDEEIGNFHYGFSHPMKPHRIRMAHTLILNYGLYKLMEIHRPSLSNEYQMSQFHADDYVFLKHVTPGNSDYYNNEFLKYNMDVDCPVFYGLYKYCQLYTGSSVDSARRLNEKRADICINWSGGLHHAKKASASGFCYINDIVLAILELLKYHDRVLYIDIDIHHGDGVEEAFYTTDRVMTVSFHKFGEYFPGTGHIKDIGVNKGKNYSINFPLRDGIDDNSFVGIFKNILGKIMERYRPSAIVMQCGADSLCGDRLGCFNLSLKGHGACVAYMKSFNIPLLVLGGGGYTIRNVSRCWTYETSLLVGQEIQDQLPYNNYYEYYGPTYKLHIETSNMENLNTPKYLENQTIELYKVLNSLPVTPSVEYSLIVPRDKDQEDRDQEEEIRLSSTAAAY